MTVCVYAIVAARAEIRRATGLAGERLTVLNAGAVGAIVGDLRRPPASTPHNLRAYHRVLQRLWERLPAMLPVRFGTCIADRDELALALRARGALFATRLRAVRRRAQMTVRVVRAPGGRSGASTANLAVPPRDEAGGEGSRRAAGGYRGGPGAAHLRARAALARQAARGLDPVRSAATPWVRAERLSMSGAVMSAYHLVPRTACGAYRRAIERAAAAAGISILVSGPFPPYAFTGELLDL